MRATRLATYSLLQACAACLALLTLGACGSSSGDFAGATQSEVSAAPAQQQSFGLPAPLQILKGLSFTDDDLLVGGADGATSPAPQNAAELDGDMVFSPSFAASGGQFSGLSYSVYGFQLNGYTADITVDSSWQTTPGNFDNVYIGVSNWDSNRWVWHRPDSSGSVNAGPSAPLISTSAQNPDLFAVAVVVTGSAEHRLDWLRVGDNLLPVAVIDADTDLGDAPLTVNFDASASYDREGGALSFEWDLDGDSVFESNTGAVASEQFEYTQQGIYVATVRVSDPGGLSSTAAMQIEVGDAGGNTLQPPTNVAASDGTSTTMIELSWLAPVAGITPQGYDVYRRADNEQNFALIGSALNTSLQDNNIPDVDELFHYKVVSIHAEHADSADSNVDTGFIGLGQVTGAAASDGTFTDRVQITWLAPAEGAAPSGYNILRADSEAGSYSEVGSVGAVLTYDDMGVTLDTVYWYKVEATKNLYPTGAQSTANDGYSQDGLLDGLLPPINVNVLGGPGIKAITWDHAGSGPDPDNYDIYRSSSEFGTYTVVQTVLGTIESWNDFDAPPGINYYKLKSTKAGYLDSDFSNVDGG